MLTKGTLHINGTKVVGTWTFDDLIRDLSKWYPPIKKRNKRLTKKLRNKR